jgi:hypothetical protein
MSPCKSSCNYRLQFVVLLGGGDCIASDVRMIDEFRGYGRKKPWHFCRLRKSLKNTGRIAGVLAGIWTENLLSTSQDSYHYTSAFNDNLQCLSNYDSSCSVVHWKISPDLVLRKNKSNFEFQLQVWKFLYRMLCWFTNFCRWNVFASLKTSLIQCCHMSHKKLHVNAILFHFVTRFWVIASTVTDIPTVQSPVNHFQTCCPWHV